MLTNRFSHILVRGTQQSEEPRELWARHNIRCLEENIGLTLPLFRQHASSEDYFDFAGCYRIVRWEQPVTGAGEDEDSSEQPDAYGSEGELAPSKGPWVPTLHELLTEAHDLAGDQADDSVALPTGRRERGVKVYLEKVVNPILSGRPTHRYVIHYALSILDSLARSINPPASSG